MTRTPMVFLAALAAVAAVAVPAPARAAADTSPPTAPGPIQIAAITETTIRLTWAPSTDDVGVVSYDVNRAFTDVVERRTTTTNEISYTGMQRSRTYSFSVLARDAAGNTSPVVSLRVIMPPGDSQPPTVPSSVRAANVTDTSLEVHWGPSVDNVLLAQYLVTRTNPDGTTVTSSVWLQPPIGPTTSLRVTGLTPATTYRFTVRARDEAGNTSAESAPVTVTTLAGPVTPPPPTSCAVIYTVYAQWTGAFTANVTIRNTGTERIDGWTAAWTLTGGQEITNVWGAIPIDLVGPDVSVRNLPWNARIEPGQSQSFGFQARWTGSNPPPVNFTVNGARCTA